MVSDRRPFVVSAYLCGVCDWSEGINGSDGVLFAVAEAFAVAYFYYVFVLSGY